MPGSHLRRRGRRAVALLRLWIRGRPFHQAWESPSGVHAEAGFKGAIGHGTTVLNTAAAQGGTKLLVRCFQNPDFKLATACE